MVTEGTEAALISYQIDWRSTSWRCGRVRFDVPVRRAKTGLDHIIMNTMRNACEAVKCWPRLFAEMHSLTTCFRIEDYRVEMQVYVRIRLPCFRVVQLVSARFSGSIPQHETRRFGWGVQGRRAVGFQSGSCSIQAESRSSQTRGRWMQLP